ncbi:MAG: hypothetical protein ACLSGS_07820 [Adlercreutzia sp.]
MEAVPQETVEKLMGNVPAQKELRASASSPRRQRALRDRRRTTC